jgi:amidase
MLRVPRDRYTVVFSADVAPVLHVKPGDEVLFETLDSWAGRLTKPEDIYVVPHDPSKSNPAAGPVYVEGAEPGDALVAEILSIEVRKPIINKITPAGGVLAGKIKAPYCHFLEVDGDEIIFNSGVRLPMRKAIGVIATAPASGVLATADPGAHGGNMDHNHVAVGSRVYLPVGVPGALFGLGDVHASCGDAEVSGAGLDCPADVRVRLSLAKGMGNQRPMVEAAREWVTCASASTLQEAVNLATNDMVEFLAGRLGISREDAYLLVTAQGDVRIGQACGSATDSTARMVFPKVKGLESPATIP